MPQSNVLATFADVPTTYWAWRSVEALAAAGITLGCGEGLFCAERTLTRAEMGVFLGRALHGSAFVPPPATGTRFDDVPASATGPPLDRAARRRGRHPGLRRLAAALLPGRPADPGGDGDLPAARPPRRGLACRRPATGTRFADVPGQLLGRRWIEQLAAEGITNGCDVNLYCPNKTVGRAEMAVFLGRAFNLPLP